MRDPLSSLTVQVGAYEGARGHVHAVQIAYQPQRPMHAAAQSVSIPLAQVPSSCCVVGINHRPNVMPESVTSGLTQLQLHHVAQPSSPRNPWGCPVANARPLCNSLLLPSLCRAHCYVVPTNVIAGILHQGVLHSFSKCWAQIGPVSCPALPPTAPFCCALLMHRF